MSNRHQNDSSDGDKGSGGDNENVPPEERERAVLEFLADHGIALPPKAIYRGMKVERDITFSYRTVQNILQRMREEGDVMRVDKDALDDGEIVPIPDDKTDRRTYYFITGAGLERIDRSG